MGLTLGLNAHCRQCHPVPARAQDKTKRELVDLKNQADSLAYQSEKQLKDAPADKLPADVKSKVRARRRWRGL